MNKYNIEFNRYDSYSSDGYDIVSTATVDGMSVSVYEIETDLSHVTVIRHNGIVYTKVSVMGSEFSHYGDWLSSDGSPIPEWVTALDAEI